MVNQYDAVDYPAARYVVECNGKHSRPGLTFQEARAYQRARESEGRTAIIRRW